MRYLIQIKNHLIKHHPLSFPLHLSLPPIGQKSIFIREGVLYNTISDEIDPDLNISNASDLKTPVSDTISVNPNHNIF